MIDVRVQSADFDPGKQLARLEALHPGAVTSFTALAPLRDEVSAYVVDHYAAMAKMELGRIARESTERWTLLGVILIHRHGRLAPGARIAFVAAAARERETAQQACDYLTCELARRAPFWRKEIVGASA